jgi:subtilisin family serine protease
MLPAPADAHPMMRYAAELRARLAKEGLPTEASGVEVYVLGESQTGLESFAAFDHGRAVTRAIAGPIGMGQGADVKLLDPQVWAYGPDLEPAEAGARMKRGFDAALGQASWDDAVRVAIDGIEGQVLRTGQELRRLVERLPDDQHTRIATISFGTDPVREAIKLTSAAIAAGNDSPLVKDFNARREAKGEAAIDVSTDRGAAILRGALIEAITAASRSGEGARRLDAARGQLEKDVAYARSHFILPIAAVGNDHLYAYPVPGHDLSSVSKVRGLLRIGATSIGDPLDPSDDRVARFSASGADLAAPGVGMPVGTKLVGLAPPEVQDLSGTSFSAPWVAGVAALMLKVNPDLSPADLERILISKDVVAGDPTTARDGWGVLDAVAAVRAAGRGQIIVE